MAVISHPDVSTDWIIATLAGDATLMAMTVTVAGVARPLQGIFYMIIPQDLDNPYPGIIVNAPFTNQIAPRFHPNGPYIASAGFLQDLRFVAQNVYPDDPGLRAMKARAIELLAGKSGTVTGGRVGACWVDRFPADQFEDRGAYQYAETLVTFAIDTQLV